MCEYGGSTIIEMTTQILKPIEWVGSSKSDLKAFPKSVRSKIGFALYQAQAGFSYRNAKFLKGLGNNVLEVISRYDGDTFRAVYTVRFSGVVYVVHAVKKKSKRGSATPKSDVDLIRSRLKIAEQHYRLYYVKEESR